MNNHRFINLILLFIIGTFLSLAIIADCFAANVIEKDDRIEISGSIDKKTYDDFKKMIETDIHKDVWIDSNGGSIFPSMEIGRLLRKYEIPIHVSKNCISSCFIIYIGSPKRFATFFSGDKCIGNCTQAANSTDTKNAGRILQLGPATHVSFIGLHRPYFSDENVNSSLKSEDARKMYDAVRAYFDEMGVSTTVFDIMMNVPPEQVKYYYDEEIYSIVPQLDPVQEEKEVRIQSVVLGISIAETRRRRALVLEICRFNGDVLKFTSPIIVRNCSDAIMSNTDPWTFQDRQKKAYEECATILTSEDQEKLRLNFKVMPLSQFIELPLAMKHSECIRNKIKN